MVDPKVVRRLIQNLQFYLNHLKNKSSVTLEEYLNDYDLQAIVERRLEEAITCCIDIGNHIISDENLRPAKSYRDVFKVLNENGIISNRVTKFLMELASFRNILVHEYADIDNKKVYTNFKLTLEIIPKYIGELIKFINKGKKKWKK